MNNEIIPELLRSIHNLRGILSPITVYLEVKEESDPRFLKIKNSAKISVRLIENEIDRLEILTDQIKNSVINPS